MGKLEFLVSGFTVFNVSPHYYMKDITLLDIILYYFPPPSRQHHMSGSSYWRLWDTNRGAWGRLYTLQVASKLMNRNRAEMQCNENPLNDLKVLLKSLLK